MKTIPVLPLVSAACVFAAGVCAAGPGKAGKPGLGIQSLPESHKLPPVAAVSREQVVQRLKQELPSADAPSESKKETWDSVRNMDVIGYNGNVTLVPKGAIVHVPERLRAQVGAVSGSILSWVEFSSKYPAVVERLDVTIEHAAGTSPLPPATLATVAKSDRIVVAVLNGGPVSLPKVEAAPAVR